MDEKRISEGVTNGWGEFSRRSILTVAGGTAIGTTALSGFAAADPDVVVDDSIQDAVEAADPGDIVEVPEGTYEESVTIETSLTLIGEGEARLDGVDGSGTGITIAASDVTVDGVEVIRYNTGITVEGDRATIENATVRMTDGRGIDADSDAVSELTVTNTDIEECGGNGIRTDDASVVVEDTTVTDSESGSGLSLQDANDVTLTNVTSNRNSGHGVNIEEGDSIELDEVEVLQNGSHGINVTTEILLERSTTLSDVESRLNDLNGLSLESTPDHDDILIEDSVFDENVENGAVVGATEVEIRTSSFTDNEGDNWDDGYGLEIEDAEDIVIENVEADLNDQSNVYINSEGVSDRTIEITDLSATDGDSNGLYIDGPTSDIDEVMIEESEFVGNDLDGLLVTTEELHLEDVTADVNTENGAVLTASDVTIFDSSFTDNEGDNWDDGHGLEIEAAEDIVIENVEADLNDQSNVYINSEGVSDRTIEITDLSATGGDSNGASIDGPTSGSDVVTIETADLSDNGNDGLQVDTKDLVVEGVTADINTENGAVLSATEVEIRDSSFSNNEGDNWDDGHGLKIEDAEDVVLENIEADLNDISGVSIDAEDALERAAEIREISATGNSSRGMRIRGDAPDGDEVTVEDSEFKGNDGDGLEFAVDDVTVEWTVVENNTGVGLRFHEDTLTEEAWVRNAEIVDNEEHGIVNEGDNELVDARQNWWGNEDGPAEDICDGDVDCSDHLTSPPGEEDEPSVEDYTNEEGIVDPPGVLEAIDDWREDEIDTPLVLDVIEAWRDGDAVS